MAPAAASAPRIPRDLAEWLAGPPKRSQYKLGQKVGCHQSMISMIARGERYAGGILAQRLARATGLPTEVFLAPVPLDDDE